MANWLNSSSLFLSTLTHDIRYNQDVQIENHEIKVWSGFPRNAECYMNFLRNVNQVSEAGPEAITAAAIQFLPYESGLHAVPWDYLHFSQRLTNFDSSSPQHQDILVCVFSPS